MRRGLIGTVHICGACGYEVLLGPGHHMDLAVCVACGADFVVEYAGGMFPCCTPETPGILFWSDSEALKADDRNNIVEIRSGVVPQPGTDLPDLSADTCPKCRQTGTLRLTLPKKCECPRCHRGILKQVGTWIQ